MAAAPTNPPSRSRPHAWISFRLCFSNLLYSSTFIVYNISKLYFKEGTILFDGTRKFRITEDPNEEMKQILTAVYDALREKGYNPINQIVGYILSEDPTYITNHNNARSLIRKIDRDELLQELVRRYLAD